MRGGEGRRIWPRRGAERARGAGRRRELAGGRRRGEARELREAGLREVRVLVMGALSAVELEEALAADADVVVWSERQVQAVAAAGGGRVHVKLDSGMGRLGTRDPARGLARGGGGARDAGGCELAGVMTHFATADDLDDGGFFAAQLGSIHGVGGSGEGRAAGADRARRQQRRGAARGARALRHGALRDRRLRDGPVRRGSGRTGPGAGARAELVCGRGEALSRGGERRVRAALRGRARYVARGAPDRLRRRLAAWVLEQRRRADRRPPLPAWWAR